MSRKWSLDSIDWDAFEPDKVDTGLVPVIRTAALVEANAADYVAYLHGVFAGDPDIGDAIDNWGAEERRHGLALGRWCELADPTFDFERALADFRARYSLPLDAGTSVRGSRAGELVARCVVESGTSSFYSSLRDAVGEPVLEDICRRIAADEFAHYRLFEKHLARYGARERLGVLRRLSIALGRVRETGDEELATAWYAANILPRDREAPFDAARFARDYRVRAMRHYRRRHVDAATRMILRAARVDPDGRIADLCVGASWRLLTRERRQLERAA